MSDYFDSDFESTGRGLSNWPPPLKAALIFTIPFVIVDFFNYYSAGTALAISCPILFLLYAGCGILTAKFSTDDEFSSPNYFLVGGTAGAILWLFSTIINTLIGVALGTLSLGTTLLLGLPYLCLCTPAFLLMGAITGGVGAVIYSSIFQGNSSDDF